jgi:ATP-dependent RNA helicase RhlE
VAEAGYAEPTPIQQQAIPLLLAGRDVLGCAQTGTGKTAAFALPILQRLAGTPAPPGPRRLRALVLTPTRELAAQIGDSFTTYGRHLPLGCLVIFGGVNENPQIAALRRGTDILVATPGRLLDLHGRGYVDLRAIEVFVLDEADRMLDMGFIHDVQRVIRQLPRRRQNLLFSATLPRAITDLAGAFLHDPARVEVTPPATTVDRIAQSVIFVAKADKPRLLAVLLRRPDFTRAIVFTRTKHGANRLAKQLAREAIPALAIHGNKSQAARTRALEGFRQGAIGVLIATDIAARGLDIDDVSHVLNYDLPNVPEVYVHRIGRTARAGAGGEAIAFCDADERAYLRDIERTIGRRLAVVERADLGAPPATAAPAPAPRPAPAAPVATPRPVPHPPSAPASRGPRGWRGAPAGRRRRGRGDGRSR